MDLIPRTVSQKRACLEQIKSAVKPKSERDKSVSSYINYYLDLRPIPKSIKTLTIRIRGFLAPFLNRNMDSISFMEIEQRLAGLAEIPCKVCGGGDAMAHSGVGQYRVELVHPLVGLAGDQQVLAVCAVNALGGAG